MNIGNKIKDFRQNKNITQNELARMICKSKSSLQKYESGETAITVDLLSDIANALDINILEFFQATKNDMDDILILVKERYNLKDNSQYGQLEYDFNILMEVLKTKYKR